ERLKVQGPAARHARDVALITRVPSGEIAARRRGPGKVRAPTRNLSSGIWPSAFSSFSKSALNVASVSTIASKDFFPDLLDLAEHEAVRHRQPIAISASGADCSGEQGVGN